MDIECGPYDAQQPSEEKNTTPVSDHQKPTERIEFEELQTVKQERHENDPQDIPHVNIHDLVTLNDLVNPTHSMNIVMLPTLPHPHLISELCPNKTSNYKRKPVKQQITSDVVKHSQAVMGMQRMEHTLMMQGTSATDNADNVSFSELYPNILSTSKLNPAKRHKTSNAIQTGATRLEWDRVEQNRVKPENDKMEGHSVNIVPQIPEVQSSTPFTEA